MYSLQLYLLASRYGMKSSLLFNTSRYSVILVYSVKVYGGLSNIAIYFLNISSGDLQTEGIIVLCFSGIILDLEPTQLQTIIWAIREYDI